MTWRQEALVHSLWLLDRAGPEYAMHAADKAERESEGVLKGLGARVRKEIAERRTKVRNENCTANRSDALKAAA